MVMNKAVEEYINKENLNVQNSNNIEYKTIDIEKETKRNSVLLGNPFLYSASFSELGITSIEDYYVKYKRENVHFGDIVRSPDLRGGKKKKIVKRIFEMWKLDYINKITKSLHDDVRLLGAKPEIIKVKFWQRLIIFLILAIYAFFVTVTFLSSEIENKFLLFFKKYVEISIDSQLYFGLLILGIILCLAGLVLSVIFNSSARRFNRIYSKNDRALSTSKTKILKDFNKRYKQVYNYYLKNIKKDGIFLEYDINKVASSEKLEIYSELVEKADLYKIRYEKKRPIRILVKYPIFIFSVLIVLYLLGYMVYVYFKNR